MLNRLTTRATPSVLREISMSKAVGVGGGISFIAIAKIHRKVQKTNLKINFGHMRYNKAKIIMNLMIIEMLNRHGKDKIFMTK